ncbi:MAG TPA: NUDIX domain-containing protein, partial [Chondromyces sp.]|nr:NUDIX domain-containing protein [Chondromyces sp.]
EEAVTQLISEEDPSSFNQALMELGALICTPTSPSCLLCPVREHCHACQEGVQDQLPIKTKKKSVRRLHMGAVVLKTSDHQFLIHKRPDTGLLATLWEFPNTELSDTGNPVKDLIVFLEKECGVTADIHSAVAVKIQHVFSHLTWDIDVYHGVISNIGIRQDGWKLVSAEELEQYAFPVSHQKIWRNYKEQNSL